MWSFNQNQGDSSQNPTLGWNLNNDNSGGENYNRVKMFLCQFFTLK